ncbi:unnamed protein product [Boreogadus saida]
MVLRRRTWMGRQYSLRRVGSYPVNSLPQPTLPGESWLTCFQEIVGRATKALNIVGSKHPGGMMISQEAVGGGHRIANGGPPNARIVPEGLRASKPRLSSQHRKAWLALAADPWVIYTMNQGYRLQFWRRPRSPARDKVTVFQRLHRALH